MDRIKEIEVKAFKMQDKKIIAIFEYIKRLETEKNQLQEHKKRKPIGFKRKEK